MHKIIRIPFLTLFSWFLVASLAGQSAIEQSFHVGSIIPNNNVFPAINHPSFMSETSYIRYCHGKNDLWPNLYKYPVFSLSLSYESLGNKQKLGSAWGITPTLAFYLIKKKKFNVQLEAGIGIAFLGRHFDKINNPDNTINGSLINFSGMAAILLEWKVSNHFRLITGPAVSHYSNGNYANPNVGANVPDWQLGIRYLPIVDSNKSLDKREEPLPAINYSLHPYARVSSGLTEKGLDGPKYFVLSATAGIARMFGRKHRVSTGFAYILNKASLNFQRHIGLNQGKEFKKASRYVWFVGHEFLFGHLGFLTEGGLYLNQFEKRKSILASKLGFNFYPFNAFKKHAHLPYLGLYIHSSFGEAEYIEMVLGYQF